MNRTTGNFCVGAMVALLLATTLLVSTSANAAQNAPEPGQRVVFVTGSTGGLGREVALALAASGDHVILHGRNVERAEAVLAAIEENGNGSARFYRADLASLDETRELADSILADYERLDVLVNNAGVFLPNQEQRIVTDDGYELHFQVNYLAGYLLVDRLMPLLESSAPSRIINVASGQRPLDLDDLQFENNYTGIDAYLRSKNAQIMMAFAMADDLAEKDITIVAMHPSSYMNTDMVIEAGFEPKSSVDTGRDAVLRLINDEVGTGKFFNVFEEADAIPEAYDAATQDALIDASERLTAQ